jgi:hypothetical protein
MLSSQIAAAIPAYRSKIIDKTRRLDMAAGLFYMVSDDPLNRCRLT